MARRPTRLGSLLWLALQSLSGQVYLIMIRVIAIRFSELLVGLCCIYFTIIKFLSYGQDTTLLSNAFFALMSSLAILSFQYANGLEKDDPIRSRLQTAGARSFHGGVLLMLASVLKYALLHIKSFEGVGGSVGLVMGLDLTLGLMAGILFLLAAIEAYMALRNISDLLVERLLDQPVLQRLHEVEPDGERSTDHP